MDDLNPYQPPDPGVVPSNPASLEIHGVQRISLPRSFWMVWLAFITVCVVFLAIVLFLTADYRIALGFISWPVLGLFLAPFIAVRAKLCERYQHRCMGSSGGVIFLACLGVCFGLGYASIGITFFLWMVSGAFLVRMQQGASRLALLLGFVLIAVIVYLKLIDLSAKRPKMKRDVVSS